MQETRLRDITLCREGFRTLEKFFSDERTPLP